MALYRKRSLRKFPGFIDVHVHLREPGATQKEDFVTGTRAALKGGFTFVCDMPNNPRPVTTLERLEEKITLADRKALCDVGFHYGTDGHNIRSFAKAAKHPRVYGLKVYCNHTTGNLLVEDEQVLEDIFDFWESKKPILVHAEGSKLKTMVELAFMYGRRLHVCHISRAKEVAYVARAKRRGQKISAGVCPHHLFLTRRRARALGPYGIMKPPIGFWFDKFALWDGLQDGTIDLVETDHAPHTREEKEREPAPFGVPGLESAVPLLFLAVAKKRLTEQDVIRLLYENPQRIFGIPAQERTYVELDPKEPFLFGKEGYESKADWSPFEGMELYGQVQRVVLRGKTVVREGRVL